MIVLQAQDLRKSFGQGSKRVEAVKGVSLSIRQGEILAFLGRNGAGKTTTIRMVAGLLHPDSGTVSINGKNPVHDRSVYSDLGKVLEGSRNLYMQLTARENLQYFAALQGLKSGEAAARASELLALFDLSSKGDARVRELSRGMQQRLSVAVSIAHRPKLLLLDEPTNGLDVESSEAIKQMLKRFTAEGMSVLLTTHQLDVAQAISDRVAVISDGLIIAEDTTEALLKRFQSDSVTVNVGTLLDEQAQASIKQIDGVLDVHVDGGKTSILLRDGNSVYQVIDRLRPAPIVSIDRGQIDLSDVFLRLVQGEKGGASC